MMDVQAALRSRNFMGKQAEQTSAKQEPTKRDLTATLNRAFAAYESGNLGEAKSLCDMILAAMAGCGDAIRLDALNLVAAV
jgi:hypothetical protein